MLEEHFVRILADRFVDEVVQLFDYYIHRLLSHLLLMITMYFHRNHDLTLRSIDRYSQEYCRPFVYRNESSFVFLCCFLWLVLY